MPQLPTYNAQRNIEARTPLPLRNEVQAKFQAGQMVAKTVESLGDKWVETQNTIQTTAVKTSYAEKRAQIELNAKTDTDLNGLDTQVKELEKAKQESLKNVSSPALRNQLAFELDHENNIASIWLKGIYKQKNVAYARETLVPKGITSYQMAMANAITPENFLKAKQDMFNLIDINVKSGIYSEAEGEKLKYESELGAAENSVFTNPEQGKQELQAGYYNLTAKDKEQLINKSDKIIKARTELADWQIKQTYTQGTFDLSQQLVDATLTPAIIRQYQQSGKIDTETAAIFNTVITKGEVDIPTTNLGYPEYFLKLIDDSLNDKSEIMKVMKDATTAYGKKQLGSNQYAYLIQEANKKFQRKSQGLTGNSHDQNIMQTALQGLSTYVKNSSLGATLINMFIERVQKGDNPQKVKSEIIEEHLDTEIQKSKEVLPPQEVNVISPDGKRGRIPSKNLEKALNMGYKVVK